jgi:hypothetical protein
MDIAHSALDIHSASEKPGAGQQQVVRALREFRKVRTVEDEPDAPAYIRDRTPLKRGQITTAALREEFRRDAALPILLSEDIFVKGIRKGVEQSEYVYQRGELLYGPGDPITSIAVDEQAVVFTMAYAKERGIWPRPVPQPAGPGPVGPGPGLPPVGPGPGGGTPGPQPRPDGPPSFTAEGLLKEALIKLWEQARTQKIERIGSLTIRLFDAADAFRLLSVVGGIRGTDQKVVVFEGGYETSSSSILEIAFRGAPADAQPLKDFLEPQLRAAKEKTMQARFEIGFADGLLLSGDAPEKMTEQLTRFATGSAYVEAIAEAKV